MVQLMSRKLLIQPQDIAPSSDRLEVIGTFNPGVEQNNGDVVLLVRVAEQPRERRDGFYALPRYQSGRVVVDWTPDHELDPLDARVVRRKADGLLRLIFTSHLRVVRIRDGHTIDGFSGASFLPTKPWEEYGVEDPRIVKLNEQYWITYVAVSRHGAATALASTADFVTFDRHGIIFCPENKDVAIFPDRIDGQFMALHRPTTAHAFCRPEMWLAKSADLLHWGWHQPLHGGTAAWESDRVGGGAPPLKTAAGWLVIYHASRTSGVPGRVGVYAAGALLLDIDDPSRILGHTPEPLWEPDADFERSGLVPDVIFPTGIVSQGNVLQVYYGAADTSTAVAELPLDEVISRCTSSAAGEAGRKQVRIEKSP